MSDAADAQDFAAQRSRMVAEVEAMYAETRGETGLAGMSPAVRAALARVERHRLVPPGQQAMAYRNHPLPIGNGQTISQPYIVALSTDLLRPEPQDVVLEVGTGSGYQAAVLAEVVKQVYTVELVSDLGRSAAARLAELGYRNVEVRIGDGYAGWPEKAPFDGIIVTAAAPSVPSALVAQLKAGGRMVIPVGGDGWVQQLKVVTKPGDGGHDERDVIPVRFVPLVPGKERLEALDQDHRRAIALHLHAIEEAHAEQREIQSAVEDHGVHVVHLDAAHAHRVELDVVDRDRPVCGAGHAALAAAIVEPQALGLAPRQRDHRRAGIDHEAHRHAVDRTVGEEVAARIGREDHRAAVHACSCRAVVLADVQQALFALQLDGRAVLLHRQHADAVPGLAELHRLGIAAVQGEHRSLVADHADQRDDAIGRLRDASDG